MNISSLRYDPYKLSTKCEYLFDGECQLYSKPCYEVKDCELKGKWIEKAKEMGRVFVDGRIL